jgi:hypothetical protein
MSISHQGNARTISEQAFGESMQTINAAGAGVYQLLHPESKKNYLNDSTISRARTSVLSNKMAEPWVCIQQYNLHTVRHTCSFVQDVWKYEGTIIGRLEKVKSVLVLFI